MDNTGRLCPKGCLFLDWRYICLRARIWALKYKTYPATPPYPLDSRAPGLNSEKIVSIYTEQSTTVMIIQCTNQETNKRIICKHYLRERQCDKIWTYQAKPDISVLFVISFELKRSLKSPCLWVELVSFSSSSPAGITFRLNSATFVSSSIAFLGLLWARSQRGDSGKNLRSKIVQEVEINIGLENFPYKKITRGPQRDLII